MVRSEHTDSSREEDLLMRPLPLSVDTAQKLAAHLKVPLEHLMHMPQHILLQKLAELAAANPTDTKPEDMKTVEPSPEIDD